MYNNVKSFSWRPSFSIIVSISWLIFLIAWFAFYAGEYSNSQNLAIIFLSILVLIVLVGGAWALFFINMIPKPGKKLFKIFGFRWRIYTSMIIPILALIGLILWFWFLGDNYNFWQNLAIFMITILLIAGAMSLIWARWGMMHKNDFQNFEHDMEDFGRDMEDFGKKIEKKFEKKDDDL